MEWRCPGVVENNGGATLMGDFRDRRNILHLERERPGALQEHSLGFGLELLRDPRADARLEIARRDSVAFAEFLTEHTRRTVNGIGHQDVVARRADGKDGKRARRQTGRRQYRARATFQIAEGLLESARRRRSAPAIGIGLRL